MSGEESVKVAVRVRPFNQRCAPMHALVTLPGLTRGAQ